jgi:hypothetical protein
MSVNAEMPISLPELLTSGARLNNLEVNQTELTVIAH